MLFELLLLVAGALVASAIGLLIYTAIASHLSYLKFKKISKGLPLLGDRRLLGNHALSWTVRTNLCTELVRAHQEKGKTIGFLYNTKFAAFSIDLDLIKLMIHDEPNKHMDRIQLNLPLYEFEHSIMLAPEAAWRNLRRHFAPALKSNKFKSPNVVREIEHSIEKLVGYIDSKLNERDESSPAPGDAGHEFEIDNLIHRYTLNLVFSCLYKQYNQINFDDAPCEWTELIEDGLVGVQRSPVLHAALLFPVARHAIDWLIWHFNKQGLARQSLFHFVRQQTKLAMEARKQAQVELQRSPTGELDLENIVLPDGTKYSRNMVDHVVDQFLDGKLTRDEYFNTSRFLLGAADKTASDCVVHTLYQLASNEAIQSRLRESVRKSGIESEYLGWVLNESLRLMPPAPVGCSRTVSRDIQLESGHVLPKGTFVYTCAYAIHRLTEYWGEDADEFKPERWRDTSHHHPMQFIPFGAGARGCPGKEFALFEMKMLLAALLTRYQFECKHKEDLQEFDSPFMIFLIPKSPTRAIIRRLQTAT